jgi:integral membrane sensor domain MASE1
MRVLVSLKEAFGKPSKLLRPALIVGVYSVCWLALDIVSSFFNVDPDVTVWSPQEGLNFVLLFVFGLRYWPALLLNIPLHAIFIPGREVSVWETAIFDTTETIIYVGVTILLVRFVRINKSLRHQRDVVWFVGAACLAAPLGGSPGRLPDSGFIPHSGWKSG